jgi:hypothetical protein
MQRMPAGKVRVSRRLSPGRRRPLLKDRIERVTCSNRSERCRNDGCCGCLSVPSEKARSRKRGERRYGDFFPEISEGYRNFLRVSIVARKSGAQSKILEDRPGLERAGCKHTERNRCSGRDTAEWILRPVFQFIE